MRDPGRLGRRLAAMAVSLALGLMALTTLAAADGGVRIRIERVDTISYPTVRFVASVVDATGHAVPGLDAKDLVVTEDAVALPARVDLASQTSPVALVFVLDSSGSMAGGALQQAVNATVALTGRLGPRDQAAIVTFRDEVAVAQKLTSDKAAVAAAARGISVDRTPLASWSTFNDALRTAGDVLREATPGSRGAIVLVSDGFAATSGAKEKATAIAQARGSLYPIYAVAVGQQLDRSTFQSIADASRGTAFFAPSPEELATAYAQVSEQLMTQYTIAYVTPKTGAPGEGRSVKLQIMSGGTVIAETLIAYSVPAVATAPAAAAAVPANADPGTTYVLHGGDSVTVSGIPATRVSTSLNASAAAAVITPVIGRNPAIVVAVLGAAASFALFLFVVNGVLPSATKGRLERFVGVPRQRHEVAVEQQRRSIAGHVVRGYFTATGSVLARILPKRMVVSTIQLLEQSGSPGSFGPTQLVGLRATTAATALVLGFVGALSLDAGGGVAVATAAGGAIFGFIAPVMVLGMRVSSRKTQIVKTLPSTVDILALSVEAGLAFDGAVAQVVLRRRNAIAEEFRRVLVEFQMGRPRKEALKELAARCGVPEVGRLTNAVTQADAMGTPLAKSLNDLAVDLRTRRRQRAEELARTAPIKMLFPMVGLIFPALFIVILGPAVPRLMTLFTQVGH